jgi:uncharacterized protein (DUF849 family)
MSWNTPLIIEARINEYAKRGGNPALPYSPAEIIREGIRAWEAGASILHWHGRDPMTGAPCHEPELYFEVIRELRQRTDLILRPTLGYTAEADVTRRVGHILAGINDPILKAEAITLDFGSFNIDKWDSAAKRFVPGDKIYGNTRDDMKRLIELVKGHGIHIAAACWDHGQIRTVQRFKEMGLVQPRCFYQLVFTPDDFPSGPPAEPHALLSMVATIQDGDPWEILYHGDAMPLAAWAIPLGGHVAIGLGDHSYDRFGKPHNGDIVAHVARLAETIGRPVASPAQTREILGLKPLSPRHLGEAHA